MDVSFLIRKNQNFINKSHLNDYKKTKKNNRKIAKTRRQRGYQWESTLVKRLILLRAGRHLD